jgi:hypothetical protein
VPPRPFPLVAAAVANVVACAASLPRVEVDRCNLGVADGNDAFTMRQGAACASLASRLAAQAEPDEAIGYARKSCQLEDASGCRRYLGLVRAHPSPGQSELEDARAAGEKACAGMVVATDGVDARAPICVQTAELYLDREPRSRSDAGRLYVRACDLGDDASCEKAKSLGAAPAPAHPAPRAAAPTPAMAPALTPAQSVTQARAPVPACHDLSACVELDVKRRNTSEVLGTLTNHCDRPAFCSFCPARGSDVDRGACHTATLAPGESKSGREAGLGYEGYSAIAFDCSDAADDRSCTP